MTHVVVGVFDDMSKVAKVRQELTSAGFSTGDVSVKSQDGSQMEATSTQTSRDEDEGGIAHFFRSLFGMDDSHEERTGLYSEAIRRNNAVVTVNASDTEEVDLAEDILDRCGAIDVEERSEQWRQEGWQPSAVSAASAAPGTTASATEGIGQPLPASSTPRESAGFMQNTERRASGDADPALAGTTSDRRKIPVVEEELQVGKREVRRGGVRVFSRVTETPVEESVQLREEKAKVTRRPVNRPATEADLTAFKEDTIEVRETAEEAVVSKKARVIEEVEVGKETTQREEKIRDTVRRTDVQVEQLGNDASRSADMDTDHDADFREHWTSNLGSSGGQYDEYAPAYRYGSTLAGSGQYTGRTWDEIEPEAREDWEKRYPGSTWERFKDSIRYGWEKLTGSSNSGAARTSQTRDSGSRPGRTRL